MDTVLQGRSKTVVIGAEQPFCIIGERINPTGRKKFAEELRNGDLSTVVADTRGADGRGRRRARRQRRHPARRRGRAAGEMLKLVQEHTDAPICIDSSVIEALEAGLAVYEGKPLVNSVTGEDDRLEEILPLVARHGAAVIGLANDETGIPETPQQRLEIATKIVTVGRRPRDPARGRRDRPARDDRRRRHRGGHDDARDDPADPRQARREHVASARRTSRSACRAGTSSTPRSSRWRWRPGLTSAIMSTAPIIVDAVRAADLLLGHDPWGASWIAEHRARRAKACAT